MGVRMPCHILANAATTFHRRVEVHFTFIALNSAQNASWIPHCLSEGNLVAY